MSADQIKICREEVASLLGKRAIIQVNDFGFISCFFLVPKASGGWRPIINLTALNYFIPHLHFKMEGVNTLLYTLRQRNWLAKVVLKDAFFSVALNPLQRKFFFVLNGKGKFFNTFRCPLVSDPAPRVFTKILKPIVGFLRQQGLRLVVYLDDIFIIGNSQIAARKAVKMVVDLFEALGFKRR